MTGRSRVGPRRGRQPDRAADPCAGDVLGTVGPGRSVGSAATCRAAVYRFLSVRRSRWVTAQALRREAGQQELRGTQRHDEQADGATHGATTGAERRPGEHVRRRSARAAREGRNPATGAAIQIAASRAAKFSAAAGLKKQLNS
jgi:DNA-binding protein HU-beta